MTAELDVTVAELRGLREILEHEIGSLRRELDLQIAAVREDTSAMRRESDQRQVLTQEAIEKAVASERDKARIHADAHAREHENQEKAAIALQKAQEKTEAAAQRAIDKAADAQHEKAALTNEWREQLTGQNATFPTREMMDDRLLALALEIRTLRDNQNAFVTREVLDERTAGLASLVETQRTAMDGSLQPLRDYMIESRAQARTWAAVVGFIVVLVGFVLRFV